MNKDQIKFLQKLKDSKKKSPLRFFFAMCSSFILISAGCMLFAAFSILGYRLLFVGHDAFVQLINSGWSEQLKLSTFEEILGIIGMAFGGGIGQLVWYLAMIQLKIYNRNEHDQEL